MDLEPEVNQAILRIRDIIIHFAKTKGWSPEDYRIFIKFNVTWGNIVVSLLAKAFDAVWFQENAIYDELLDYLERELADDVGLYESIGLNIYQFADYAYKIANNPHENYVDINEQILNPDIADIHPIAPVSQRKSD